MAATGRRCTGRLRPSGGRFDATLRVGDGQGAPPEIGARSRAQRAAERDRSEDRRLGERARVAYDARATLWRRGRVGNPPDGARGVARAPERSGLAVLRFRDLRRRRQTGSRARHIPQGVVPRRSFDGSSATIFFATTFLSTPFSLAYPVTISYSGFSMRIGLAYNEKPDVSATSDDYAEWDDPSTIDAVDQALSLFGNVVRLEADEFSHKKLPPALPNFA